MTTTRIHTQRIDNTERCPVCTLPFVGMGVTIDSEPTLYCSHRCAKREIDVREKHTTINADVWNPLYSCYEAAT